MKVKEIMDKLIQQGKIDKANIQYKPRDMAIKKVALWINPTPICPRWDGEIWYKDNRNQRISSINSDTLLLLFEVLKDKLGE